MAPPARSHSASRANSPASSTLPKNPTFQSASNSNDASKKHRHRALMEPATSVTGVAAHLAGCRLTVDLDALAHNYRLLRQKAAPTRVAGVVKADAYGLGIEEIAPLLAREG